MNRSHLSPDLSAPRIAPLDPLQSPPQTSHLSMVPSPPNLLFILVESYEEKEDHVKTKKLKERGIWRDHGQDEALFTTQNSIKCNPQSSTVTNLSRSEEIDK